LALQPLLRQLDAPSDFNGINLLQPFEVDGLFFFVARNSGNRLVLCLQDQELTCIGKPCSHRFAKSPAQGLFSSADFAGDFWSLLEYDFVQTAQHWIKQHPNSCTPPR
jgi:hypothetical protein